MIVVWQRKHECLDEHIADLCGGADAGVACRRAAAARRIRGAAVRGAAVPAAGRVRPGGRGDDGVRAEERNERECNNRIVE